eukprot:4179146-Pleurochrysis_carterae.AAC.2
MSRPWCPHSTTTTCVYRERRAVTCGADRQPRGCSTRQTHTGNRSFYTAASCPDLPLPLA